MARKQHHHRSFTKRAKCPKCGKAGLSQSKAFVTAAVSGRMRECRYCRAVGVRAYINGEFMTEEWK